MSTNNTTDDLPTEFIRLLTVKSVSETLGVKVETVTHWIRTGKMLAQKNAAAQWRIREDDFRAWVDNGHKLPDSKAKQGAAQEEQHGDARVKKILETIATYPAHETGKSVKQTHCRIPTEWGVRIDRILKRFPQYENHQSYLFRDALQYRMAELESIPDEADVSKLDPMWAVLDVCERDAQRVALAKRTLSGMAANYLRLKEESPARLKEFIDVTLEFIANWQAPWKDKAIKILEGKELAVADEGDGYKFTQIESGYN